MFKILPKKIALLTTSFALAFGLFAHSNNNNTSYPIGYYVNSPLDTVPFNEWYQDWLNNQNQGLDLKDPSIIKKEVEYDPEKNLYIITEKIGDEDYRPPTYMTFDEYMEYTEKEAQQEYFRKLSGVGDVNRSSSGIADPISRFNIEDNLVDRLFGGSKVDIRPQGSIDVTFGWNYSRRRDPGLTIRQQTNSIFDFDLGINMSVQGKIGEKLNLNFNYNSEPTFDFDNQIKIQYDPTQFSEDDIIQNIEAGDVSLPLQGTLIQGAQSLFGLRLDTKWGNLNLSTIIAQQKSDREELTVQGGAQFQEFEVFADEYEENRHFFLSHYNRNIFEESLADLPAIRNVFQLERIQVFITGERVQDPTDLIDIVALADLGEVDRIGNVNTTPNVLAPRDFDNRVLPDNTSNDLFESVTSNERVREIDNAVFELQRPPFSLQQSKDFERIRARILEQGRDYVVNAELGFVSLRVPVQPDHIIGVSYQYSYNGEVFQVGEFSNKIPPVTIGGTLDPQQPTEPDDSTEVSQNVVFTKMLKSATQRVDIPLWDLMMKNVYNIGAFNVNRNDFQFGIFYDEPGIGEKQFMPIETGISNTPLVSLFNLDRLNSQNDPCPDGEFDFVPGVTIEPRNGRVIFPLLEPFGSSLSRIYQEDPDVSPEQQALIDSRFAYTILYDSTVTRAREYPDFNRFVMRGTFKSEVSNEIQLNSINIPRNSLRVTAGGAVLTEGVDYEVDYTIGRVRILNDAYIQSGVPIRVSFEDRSLFGFQQKNLIGVRADYDVSENFQVGATYMHLFERPFTQKVNIGDDPINNRVYGLDFNWGKEVPFFTKMVDALPFIDTKVESSINIMAEGAAIQPGHSRAINEGDGEDSGGVVLIDDFEGAFPELTLSAAALQEWVLASTPRNDNANNNPLFPEASASGTTPGVNRALLNWFLVDEQARSPENASPYTDQVSFNEIFREAEVQSFQNITRPLVINYNPTQRGPYNFDLPNGTNYSEGVEEQTGELKDPASRWAGITRNIENNDFEANNVEFIEFWMLSPFLDRSNVGQPSPDREQQQGDIYINIGNVSEDALRDSRLSYENGLPGATNNTQRTTQRTAWGRVPAKDPILQAFDNDPASRALQDIGLDGLDDGQEIDFFDEFLQESSAQGLDPTALAGLQNDPCNDNFQSFLEFGDTIPVVEKYRRFNNPEGNSPVNQGNSVINSSRLRPDTEDLNDDGTLNESEAYFQYRIPIENDPDFEQGIKFNRFVKDSVMVMRGGELYRVWYNFQIPITAFEAAVGGIQDFRSIRFIRMFFNGFETETTFAMVDLKLTRSQWRQYRRSLKADGPNSPDLFPPTNFNITDVGINENSTRVPFNYVLPEGIQREITIGGFQPGLQQDERSLAITLQGLQDGDARGVYRLSRYDLRLYDRMRMFVHAEIDQNDPQIRDGDISAFIRFGGDFEDNYYEYEIPLTFSRDVSLNERPIDELALSREVWRAENNFDFEFDLMKNLKIERNDAFFPLNEEYVRDNIDRGDGFMPGRVRIKGNPDLGNVKGVMIGLRNELNDGVPHSAQVWVNELRVNGLDERGGVAGLARMDITLADLAQLTAAGNFSGIGYGGIDQQLLQRNQEELRQYDLSAQMNLGRFFGENSRIKLPVLAQYSNLVSTPRFDPNTGDLEVNVLKDKSSDVPALLDTILTKSEIKTINFTNVKIERKRNTEKKLFPWDISNFNASYSYTERNDSDPKTELSEIKDHYGTLDYSYNLNSKPIKPFKKLIKKDKYLKFLSEFNFNPLPQAFTFSTAIDRDHHQVKRRFAGVDEQFNTFFEKKFIWDRDYSLNWDFAKSLKFNFNATNMSIIDELKNFDEGGTKRTRQELNNHIWTNVRDLGRTRNYSHNFSLSYAIPFKTFPFLDFITGRAQYNANYGWTGASLNATEFGNVIQNSQKRDFSADLNFEKLYNKSGYLKKIGRKKRSSGVRNRRNAAGTNRRDNTPKATNEKKKKKESGPSKIEKALVRPLLVLRSAKLRYSQEFSTVVPGFTPQSSILGLSDGFGAPGWEFISGLQPGEEWFDEARDLDNRWITDNFFLNQKVQQNFTETLDGQIKLEPFNDFRINVDIRKRFSENSSVFFKDREPDGIYNIERILPTANGSLELTFFTANTLFGTNPEALFRRYEENRVIIANRIGDPNSVHADDTQSEFPRGFGRTQQDVLIPAFVAAYTGRDASTTGLNIFELLPLPNWNLTYDGLGKIDRFKELFKRVTLRHGYQSTLTLNSYQTDLNFDASAPTGNSNINAETDNFFSSFEIPDIVIRESFSPLLGVSVETNNNLTLDFSVDRSRDLQMNLFTFQLSETQSSAYRAGFQYTKQGVTFDWLQSGKKKKKSDDPNLGNQVLGRGGGRTFGNNDPQDLTIGFEFSLNDDETINHFLDEGISESIRGQFVLRVSPAIDYQLNNQLNLRLFVDYTNTRPKTSVTPPTTNIFGGLTVSFTLQ